VPKEREDQYAYRNNRDRTSMLLMILADTKRKIRQHGGAFIGKGDVKKAYDKMNREVLITFQSLDK
jgi:hypothetical protein